MLLHNPGNTHGCDSSIISNQHLKTLQVQPLEILPGCHVAPETLLTLFQALVIDFLFFFSTEMPPY